MNLSFVSDKSVNKNMDRKKSFQMWSRFERAKTPMGAVPISVIMGFDYPLGDWDTEPSGRGELTSSYNYKSGNSSTGLSSDLNTNYMNTNMLERLPRPANTASSPQWPASLPGKRTDTQRSYMGNRAKTEVTYM